MSILDQLNQDLKHALKAKETLKLSVIRMLKTSLQNEAIKLQKELSEDEELNVLTRELKQRRDSLMEFEKADREDLASQTRNEIEIVEAYLPPALSGEELREIILGAVEQVGATSKKDMGKVMGIVMPKVKGRADGNLINRLVSEILS